jgi:signal transduction histidine kinase/CheY-like chemotaxis protein
VIPEDRREEEDHVLSRIRAGLRVEHYETIRRRKDGTLIPVSLTISPIRTPEGVIVGASKIARDITDRQRAEADRQRLLELAHEASRLKEEFLATLSHELRTPLNGIVGFVHLLQNGMLPAARQQWAFDAIGRSVAALTRIVEDVLDVSRIVSGKVIVEMKVLDLAEVVETALAVVRPAMEAKQIGLAVELEEVGSVMGDSDRLRQVVCNLLANAVKFSDPQGTVVVRLRQSDGVVILTIRDTGVGIAPAFLPYVFDRFRQEDQGITRRHGGLGLGLAISKHLVELHGGRIFAESGGVGQGATVTVELPVRGGRRLAQPAPAWIPPGVEVTSGTRPEVPRLSGLSVLAVDDDPAALILLREMVEMTGATIVTADSSREALRLLDDTAADILLADLGMPGMSGLDLIRILRHSEEPRLRHLPAAALTAYAHSEDRTRSLAAGFDLHLPKPVGPEALFRALATLARLRR